MRLDEAEHAYRTSPEFKQAVDAMAQWITHTGVTPAEVRAAAMLACYQVECRSRKFYAMPPYIPGEGVR